MDKMLYKILFSLEPSNRNTARPAPPREKEKEREIGRSKKGIGPEVCPPPVQSALARPSPREVPVAAVVFLLLHGPPPFSRDCTYLHGIPNGDSPIRARVSLDLAVTDVSQSKRRKNAHLGGCPVEFLAAVLQSRHSPLVSESILCIPWRSADGLLPPPLLPLSD